VADDGREVRPARPAARGFYFDGEDVIVYSEPNAAKVRHVKAHSRVSLNLDSDGNGSGIVDFLAACSTRLKITVDKVWTTPTGG
jgi:hypothetical protein